MKQDTSGIKQAAAGAKQGAASAVAAKKRDVAKRASFVKGALILAVGGFIGKLLGAIYRIPLTNVLGAEGMGLYQMIFPLYSLLLTVSSGGIPTALSRLVAERCALGHEAEAGRLARNASISLTVLGILCAASVAALSGVIARAQGNGAAAWSYLAIAPAIVFVAVISSVRGFFQGREMMTPSAVSQIVEQVVKLGAGLGFAVLLLPRGIAAAAFGATLGVTLSEAVAMVVLLIQRHRAPVVRLPADRRRAFLADNKELYSLAIPVTLGGIVMPLTQLIDSGLVINILKRFTDVSTATALYGLAGGPVGSLINMPVVISLAIATAILPSVSASRALGDADAARKKAGLAIRLTLLVALPCAALFALFPHPMIELLYGRGLGGGTFDEIGIAGQLLGISSVTVLLIALIQVSTNLLHAVGHNYTPVVHLGIGAAVKVVLDVTLLPVIGIYAVAVSNIACYAAAAILDLIMLAVYVRPRVSFLRGVAAPLGATLVTAGIGYGLFRILLGWSGTGALLVMLPVAATAYCLLIPALGALTQEEMRSVPFLNRIFGFRSKKRNRPKE